MSRNRILIVDDEPAIREMVAVALELADFDVLEAENAQRGHEIIVDERPYLVLLDEPSEGVAPVIVEQMAHMILELKEQGVSILLSEQNMHFAELVSDRAYVLEKGQIRYQASMEQLAANEEVRRAYLSV